VEEARERLREAASKGDPLRWAKRHPVEGILGAFIFGFLTGTTPKAREALRDTAFLLLKRR
jgi:hypothetical protein